MATLRLFASLREIAGASRVDVPGDTVGAVIDEASSLYGSEFSKALGRARIWVNGEEAADRSQVVGPEDEVALIPPVSGGSSALGMRQAGAIELVLPLGALALLVLANLTEGGAWWAAAIVGVVVLWAGDLASTSMSSGRDLPLTPILATVVGTVVSVHLLGLPGLGLALAVAVVAPLVWAVASDSSRVLNSLASATIVSLIVGGVTGSLLLVRSVFVPAQRAVGVYLVVAIVATGVGMLLERVTSFPIGDPFSAAALSAIISSVVAAAVWDMDIVAFLVAGLAMAIALIGGRALGSILRTRRVLLLEHPPGYLPALDGAVLAGWIYLPALLLVIP